MIYYESEVCNIRCNECMYSRYYKDSATGEMGMYCGVANEILEGNLRAIDVPKYYKIPKWCPVENNKE